MRKTLLVNLTALLLLFSIHSNLQSQMICEAIELNSANIEDFILLATDYYDNNYSDPYPETDEAMDRLREFLNSEITNPGYSKSCDPGVFWYAGFKYPSFQDNKYRMYFRWDVNFDPGKQHIGKLYDFATGQGVDAGQSNPDGISISDIDPFKKLVLLNTFCEDIGQSKTYVMIIIDRDINFYTINNACDKDGPALTTGPGVGFLPIPRLTDEARNSLKVYPNPSLTTTTLEFDLRSDQKVSLQLIAANSGKIISTFFENENLKSGNHTRSIQSDRLGAGLYYVLLQTENERIVQKLIRL